MGKIKHKLGLVAMLTGVALASASFGTIARGGYVQKTAERNYEQVVLGKSSFDSNKRNYDDLNSLSWQLKEALILKYGGEMDSLLYSRDRNSSQVTNSVIVNDVLWREYLKVQEGLSSIRPEIVHYKEGKAKTEKLEDLSKQIAENENEIVRTSRLNLSEAVKTELIAQYENKNRLLISEQKGILEPSEFKLWEEYYSTKAKKGATSPILFGSIILFLLGGMNLKSGTSWTSSIQDAWN